MTPFRKASSRLDWKRPQAAAVFLLCSTLIACIGATPLPQRTRTASGTEMKKVDMSFLQPGLTTREEVREKLKVIDTGFESDRYFIGRWSSSTWGGWIILVGSPCCGSGATGGRVWKTGNLLVEFDEQGVVGRVVSYDVGKSLKMLRPIAEETPVRLDPPVEMPVHYWKDGSSVVPARIILSKEKLFFEELGDEKKKHIFAVPARDVRKVVHSYVYAGTDAGYLGDRIECAHDLKKLGGPHSKHINLQLTPPQLITLMRYVSDAGGTTEQETTAKAK